MEQNIGGVMVTVVLKCLGCGLEIELDDMETLHEHVQSEDDGHFFAQIYR